MEIVRKATTASVDGSLEYVLSDASIDRYGDSIDAEGWDLKTFSQNPIALFNHDSKFPIGKWTNLRVEGGKLRGHLQLAKAGTSARIDEIRSLAEQGILRAVSVGFRPLEAEPLPKKGMRYKRSELLETSLVSVPANPNALQVAKSLHVSADTQELVFGRSADTDGIVVRRGLHGEHAAIPPVRKNTPIMTTPVSKRIEDAQTKLVALTDQLNDLVNKSADTPDEASEDLQDELTLQIEAVNKSLERDRRTEAALASTSEPVSKAVVEVDGRRPFAVAAEKVAPGERVLRSLVAMAIGHAQRKDPMQALVERYGSDGKIDDASKIIFDVVTKAASAPATTTTSGWASQLVQTDIMGFMDLLMPASVYPGLAARGLRMNFGRAGVISIPSRVATPTIAGSFVLEGNPIPVRQGAFTSTTYTPKKMAVISTFTRQIAEHSTPAIEGLIRNAIQEDTSVALDTVLLDATAASTTRPAGLKNGVSVTTASAATLAFDKLVADMKALVGALISGSNGNLRQPVWIMNPIQALSISVIQNAGGDFPFAAEINQNRFQGYPVILSSTVASGTVYLVDAADFVAIEGNAPRFDVSDQATLHMEDTTPLAIGTAGTPTVVAAPVRSLFQTDSIALRMMFDVNWGMRRTGVVAWTESVGW